MLLATNDPTELVAACVAGDQRAWQQLVKRYTRLVWTVARSHRLSNADSQDVYQATFLQLVRQIDKLRSPDRIASWITTTARRESLKHIERSRQYLPVGDSAVLDRPAHEEDRPDAQALRLIRDEAVARAFRQLPERDQTLLGLLMSDAQPSYDEVGRAMRLPHGSIGPLRQRALGRLRDLLTPAVPE